MKAGHRLVKDHGHAFEVAPPKGGPIFMVAKRGLDKRTLSDISALPKVEHHDDGGMSGEDDSGDMMDGQSPAALQANMINAANPGENVQAPPDSPPSITTPGPGGPGAAVGDQIYPTPNGLPPGAMANPNTLNPSMPGQAGSGGQQNPSADLFGSYEQAYGTAAEGIKNAQAAADQANQQSQAVRDQMTQGLAASQARTDQNQASWQAQQTQLENDMKSGKIDPNRIWNNASTGNKIAAGLGVMLSGIGSGLTGQPNMAMQVINNAIDKDIDAQKANLGKTATIMEMNYRKYGNMQSAEAASRATLLGTAQIQLQSIAANAQNSTAAAAAQNGLAQLGIQKAQMMQQAYLFGLKNDIANGNGVAGGGQGLTPATAERLYPKQWANVPNPDGTSSIQIAKSPEDAKVVNDMQDGASVLQQTVNEARDFMKKNGTSWTPETKAQAEAIRARALTQVNELAGQKRFTENDKDIIQQQFPDPGAFFQGAAGKQLDEVQKTIDQRKQATYANHLMNYNPGAVANGFKPAQ